MHRYLHISLDYRNINTILNGGNQITSKTKLRKVFKQLFNHGPITDGLWCFLIARPINLALLLFHKNKISITLKYGIS